MASRRVFLVNSFEHLKLFSNGQRNYTKESRLLLQGAKEIYFNIFQSNFNTIPT